jgi:branched-chain amino acid transport system substrate-binding protein
MKKRLWAVVIVVALILIAYFAKPNQDNAVVKIGFSIPLTGNMAFAGEGIKIAAQMAKESFGQTNHNYEFIFEDDEFKPEKTASVVNKLINVDKVDAVVSFGAAGGNVVSPITEQNKIIHFGVTTDLNVAKGDYNFIHFTLPPEQTKAFVEELNKRGIKKVAYFVLNSQGYLATEADVKDNLMKAGIDLVSEQKFNTGEKDFKTYISKAKLTNADIWVLGAQSPELDVLAQQIKDFGINTPITSINSFEVSKNPSLYEGQWYVGSAAPSQKFVDIFTNKAGYSPTFGSANIYDIVSLIIAGAENSSIAQDHKNLLEQIRSIEDFNGALGLLNFDGEGAVISKAAIKIIKNGKPLILSNE